MATIRELLPNADHEAENREVQRRGLHRAPFRGQPMCPKF
jgi:hypothetical protein